VLISGYSQILPRALERDSEDLAGVLVALDRDPRLEKRSGPPLEARLDVNLQRLDDVREF
jgi:hypothetical protein